ncbi:MAG: efflux RND transporter periplasmic adaptor subunit [Thermoguttaceae bacterium]
MPHNFSHRIVLATFVLVLATALTLDAQDRRNYPPSTAIGSGAQQAPSVGAAPPTVFTPTTATSATPTMVVGRDEVRLLQCLMEVKKEVSVSANTQGVLQSLRTAACDAAGKPVTDENGQPVFVDLKEGVQVLAGQVLGRQDDRLAQADLKIAETDYAVAQEEANKQIEVEHARTAWMVEDAKVQMLEEANARVDRAVSQTEVLEAKMRRKQAEAQFELCQYTLGVRRKEAEAKKARLDAATVQVTLRQLVAPWNGEVVEVKAAEGEWLREGAPVVRIIQLERLRVRGKVDSAAYAPEMFRGRPATVVAKMVDGRTESFPAQVSFANYIVQSGNTFEVHIEVDNRRENGVWMLQPGKMVDVIVHGAGVASTGQ